jgi:hypothetical protein
VDAPPATVPPATVPPATVPPGEGVRVVHPDAQRRADEQAQADWQAAERAVAEWEAVEEATPPGTPPPAEAVVEEYVEE